MRGLGFQTGLSLRRRYRHSGGVTGPKAHASRRLRDRNAGAESSRSVKLARGDIYSYVRSRGRRQTSRCTFSVGGLSVGAKGACVVRLCVGYRRDLPSFGWRGGGVWCGRADTRDVPVLAQCWWGCGFSSLATLWPHEWWGFDRQCGWTAFFRVSWIRDPKCSYPSV